MKMYSFLLSIPLNHSITVLEFFHWLTSRCFIKAWLIFSNLTLLTFLSSLFEGLIRLQVKLAWKFSLWSFRVIKAGFFARHSTLSTRPNLLTVFDFQIYWLSKTFCWFFVYLCYIFLEKFFIFFWRCFVYIISLVDK